MFLDPPHPPVSTDLYMLAGDSLNTIRTRSSEPAVVVVCFSNWLAQHEWSWSFLEGHTADILCYILLDSYISENSETCFFIVWDHDVILIFRCFSRCLSCWVLFQMNIDGDSRLKGQEMWWGDYSMQLSGFLDGCINENINPFVSYTLLLYSMAFGGIIIAFNGGFLGRLTAK